MRVTPLRLLVPTAGLAAVVSAFTLWPSSAPAPVDAAAAPGVSVADLTDTPAQDSVVQEAPTTPAEQAALSATVVDVDSDLPAGVASLFNPRSAPVAPQLSNAPSDTPSAPVAPAPLLDAPVASRDAARAAVAGAFGVDTTSALLVAQCASGTNSSFVSAPDAAGVRRWGLFQISDDGPLQALLSASGRDPQVLEAALDPGWNAAAARTIASTAGWAPWACAAGFNLPALTPPPPPVAPVVPPVEVPAVPAPGPDATTLSAPAQGAPSVDPVTPAP